MAKKKPVEEVAEPVAPETEPTPTEMIPPVEPEPESPPDAAIPPVEKEPKQKTLEMHIDKIHDLRFKDDAGFVYRLEDYKGIGTYWLVQV